MFQQITPPFAPITWANLVSKLNPRFRYFALLGPIIWLLGMSTASASANETSAAVASDTLITASICAGGTYLFDGELLNTSGEYVAVYVAADGSDSTVTLQLTVLPLSFTNLDASICEGATYPFNGQDLDQSGTYSVTLEAENGCDSIVTLHLVVLPPQLTSLDVSICKDRYYVFQGDTLTENGVYSVVLIAENGCDSIVTLNLKVVSFFETPLSASICAGESYIFDGDTLTLAGIYVDTLTAGGGCDSFLVLTLNVLPNAASSLSVSLCEGSSYAFFGEIYTVGGIYTAQLTAANGCDSIVTLNLSFVPFFETTAEQTICDGDSYVFGDETLTDAGVYTHQFTAQGGCDSTVTLTLIVLPTSTGTDQATICAEGSFEYNGEVLTDAGEYLFILEAENGCDSTVTFTLNVLPAIGSAVEATICNGDTYGFAGEILTDAGTYEAILTADNGCDSVVTLTLKVLPTQETALSAAICTGETYVFNGDTLSDSGTYIYELTGENGCDSTVTLVLTVNPTQSTSLNVDICEGESYEFDGILISDPGEYTATYTGDNGCDSTVTLLLGVLPVQNTAFEVTICSNQTYTFNNELLSDAGTYTAVLTGANGCDSTVVLTLSVLPVQNTFIAATICEGDTYNYQGIPLSDAGDFEFIFQGENGCDSNVVVSITVLPVANTSISATICANESYDYNGDTITDGGTYVFVFDAFNGCDSTVTLNLTVLPLSTSLTAASLCEGASYAFNGDTLTTSGTYEYVFVGENGCDSTATLVLEFVGSFETNLEASICAGESYVFGNDTITASGDYSQLLSAQGGCDSLVILELTVLPFSQSSTEASICDGETYDFNGLALTTAGTYSFVLTGANGCDSTAVLNLSVLPLQNSALEASICANETYSFNGLALDSAGTYTAVLTSANGCDSTVVLTLNVLPTTISALSATICANESYDFDGLILVQAGVYTATYASANGCDSVVTLNLSVLPLAETAFAVSVCNGESFEYNGEVLTQSGEYQFMYPGAAANGCDSVETLFLTIFPLIPPTAISASICAGESYDFYGTELTAAGTFTADLSSSVGCDSTIVLTLSVLPTAVTNLSASICAGESYPFNGQNLTDAGTYTVLLSTTAGCDSTVILTLAVNTVNTNVSQQGGTITAAATNASYQWVNCANNQPIPGATGNTYTPSATGNYAVVVTQNGCTATSTCVFVQVVSTNEPLAQGAWSLQPNPAAAATQLVFMDATTEALWLEIHDMAGRLLFSQNVETGTQRVDLELNGLPEGMLIVRLSTNTGVTAKRLMKTTR